MALVDREGRNKRMARESNLFVVILEVGMALQANFVINRGLDVVEFSPEMRDEPLGPLHLGFYLANETGIGVALHALDLIVARVLPRDVHR